MSMPSASKTFQTLQTCICFFWAVSFQVAHLSTFKALLAIHHTTDKRSLTWYLTTKQKILNFTYMKTCKLHKIRTLAHSGFVPRDLGTERILQRFAVQRQGRAEWLLSSFGILRWRQLWNRMLIVSFYCCFSLKRGNFLRLTHLL